MVKRESPLFYLFIIFLTNMGLLIPATQLLATLSPKKMAFIARTARILRWTSTLSEKLALFGLSFGE
jgi:hypothetical protein